MKTLPLLFLAFAAVLSSACLVTEPTEVEYPAVQEDAEPVVVAAPPPDAQVEVAPPAVVGQVWVPGYWWWGPSGYVWVRGRYVVGRPGAVWVGPRYVFRGGVHYYYGGRWVRRR